MVTRSKWCLIGIPDHQGVENVGGRIGAASGPQAFQRNFHKFKGREGVIESLIATQLVAGLGPEVSKNHELAAQTIEAAHKTASTSVIIGGGHDHGYSHLLGISRMAPGKKLGCLNLDAHLDVRKPAPIISSGSPFYLAIESGCLDPANFVEFGIQRHCNAPELWEYVESKPGLEVVPFESLRNGKAVSVFREKLRALELRCDMIVISFDLDSAAAVFAPGVSAPQSEGFTSSEIIEMMEIAGASKHVVSLGIFELNPVHDIDDRTAKLAATAAYHFIAARSG